MPYVAPLRYITLPRIDGRSLSKKLVEALVPPVRDGLEQIAALVRNYSVS